MKNHIILRAADTEGTVRIEFKESQTTEIGCYDILQIAKIPETTDNRLIVRETINEKEGQVIIRRTTTYEKKQELLKEIKVTNELINNIIDKVRKAHRKNKDKITKKFIREFNEKK